MDVGLNGLTGQHAPKSAKQEIRPGRDRVPTHPRLTMVGTVGERMLKRENVILSLVKVAKSK